ncbi:MAG: DUF1622 domain-containing protein [Lachnospiraceae bacterium]|jgi:uncharacterized membrane protein|nr:DUF1622 domain-containing protein [Lachnospiraceae bacterium]
METVHEVLSQITNGAILLFEFMGVLVILISGFNGVRNYFRKNPFTRLKLAQGMAMGLEFKLGSEILRTVVVREWQEIALVAGIVALRAALTFLIHWEIQNEKKEFGELEEKKLYKEELRESKVS